MTDYRQQAIRDVAEALRFDAEVLAGMVRVDADLLCNAGPAMAYAVAQRERTLELEAQLEEAENKLRAHDGLVALRNGIPETTGDPVFDKVLRLFPVAAMLQRSWLAGVTGFDKLPFLKESLLQFFDAQELSDLLDENFWKKRFGVQAQLQQKEGERG